MITTVNTVAIQAPVYVLRTVLYQERVLPKSGWALVHDTTVIECKFRRNGQLHSFLLCVWMKPTNVLLDSAG